MVVRIINGMDIRRSIEIVEKVIRRDHVPFESVTADDIRAAITQDDDLMQQVRDFVTVALSTLQCDPKDRFRSMVAPPRKSGTCGRDPYLPVRHF